MKNKLEKWFFDHKHNFECHKWHHYFKIYHTYFKKFIGKNPTILEIGVHKGGSLEMWNYYFDNNCTIYGIDIDTSCKAIESAFKNVKIEIGDQGSQEFWESFKSKEIDFDIIIDDGGHQMKQQILSFEQMYSQVKSNGIYLIEDTHTSYWSNYNAGLNEPNTFIEYSKNWVDAMNIHHLRDEHLSHISEFKKKHSYFRNNTKAIHFYDSVVVLEKGINNLPINSMI